MRVLGLISHQRSRNAQVAVRYSLGRIGPPALIFGVGAVSLVASRLKQTFH
jgi:hypothetical protein